MKERTNLSQTSSNHQEHQSWDVINKWYINCK